MKVRGWCPDALTPMQAADGFVARIKAKPGGMKAETAATIARTAAELGSGVIEITGRGNIQVRGLPAANLPRFRETMVAAGAADERNGHELRRICTVSPLAGSDPEVAAGVCELAEAIDRHVAGEPAFSALPAKFQIMVEGGGVAPLRHMRADIAIHVGAEAAIICLEGSGVAARCRLDEAEISTIRLIHSFIGGKDGQERFRDFVTRVGAENLFRHSGLCCMVDAPDAGPVHMPPTGYMEYKGGRVGAVGVVPPFGATDSAAILKLCETTRVQGDGYLRFGGGRTIWIAGVAGPSAGAVLNEAEHAAFIVDSSDPRLRIAACPGSDGCAEGVVPARQDAAVLASLLGGVRFLHVSGCMKGCAHPLPASVTLVGRCGRYDLVLSADTRGEPLLKGLTLGEAVAWLDAQSKKEVRHAPL